MTTPNRTTSPASGQELLADRARNMRITATLMLVAMAAVFVVTHRLLDLHPAWGYVNAFAEAAMVGGLADWFAVTALFRHPLGVPIPPRPWRRSSPASAGPPPRE